MSARSAPILANVSIIMARWDRVRARTNIAVTTCLSWSGCCFWKSGKLTVVEQRKILGKHTTLWRWNGEHLLGRGGKTSSESNFITSRSDGGWRNTLGNYGDRWWRFHQLLLVCFVVVGLECWFKLAIWRWWGIDFCLAASFIIINLPFRGERGDCAWHINR